MGVSSMIPMRGIFARCCARAASGHAAAAPPSSVRNIRRFMSNIDSRCSLGLRRQCKDGGRALHILLARRENAPKCLDQPIELDWFGIELVTPCSERLFTLAGQRVCREGNDRDIAGLRIIP